MGGRGYRCQIAASDPKKHIKTNIQTQYSHVFHESSDRQIVNISTAERLNRV